MKASRLIPLLILLVLAGCQEKQNQSSSTKIGTAKFTTILNTAVLKPTERPENVSWGEEDPYKLQMGCWFDSNQQIIWCVIRNNGDRSIRYSDYLLGYWESVKLKALSKESGKWHVVDRKKNFPQYYKSAGASSSNVHIIHLGKEMLPPYNEKGTLIPIATEQEYTFGVNLKDFEWPDKLKHDIHIVVSQSLGGDGSKNTWKGLLESGQVLVEKITEKTKNSQQKNPPDKK